MPFRSFHFIPAHRYSWYSKINECDADQYIFDLEDGVPLHEKDIARSALKDFLPHITHHNIWIRMNGYDSSDYDNDIRMIRMFENIGVVIPKYQCKNHTYDALNSYRKICIIEDLKNLRDLPFAHPLPHTIAYALGLEDMLTVFPQENSALSTLIGHIKSQFVQATKLHALLAIDGIVTEYHDMNMIQQECIQSVACGFDGKFSIHPAQLPIIHDCFTLKESSIQWAKKVYEMGVATQGLSGYQIKNDMLLTPPKFAKAKTILQAIDDHEEA